MSCLNCRGKTSAPLSLPASCAPRFSAAVPRLIAVPVARLALARLAGAFFAADLRAVPVRLVAIFFAGALRVLAALFRVADFATLPLRAAVFLVAVFFTGAFLATDFLLA